MPALSARAALLVTAVTVAAGCGGAPGSGPGSDTGRVETFVEGHGPGGGPCVAELTVDGRRYGGPSKPGDPGGDLPIGVAAGAGTVLCHEPYEIATAEVAGLPPELALHVVAGEQRWIGVWVRFDYCGVTDLLGCLFGLLEVEGRLYAETVVSDIEGASPADAEFPRGASLGRGTIGPDGSVVAVTELAGVDPAIAVLVEGRPRSAYLALDVNVDLDGTCYQTAAAYVRCLQTRAGA